MESSGLALFANPRLRSLCGVRMKLFYVSWLIVGSRTALSRESTSALSAGARVRRGHSETTSVLMFRHMFLIIPDRNNITVEEFRVISCYQSATLFIVAGLGGLMGLKPLGAPDWKSNYAHSSEWLWQMEWLLHSCLFSAS